MIDFQSPEFWLATCVCLVIVLMARPVSKSLGVWGKNQAAAIKKEIDTASTLRKEAESLYQEYEEKTKNVEKEKINILTIAEKEAFLLQQKADKELSEKIGHKKVKINEKIALIELHAQKEMMTKMLRQVVDKTNQKLKTAAIRQDEASMDTAIENAFTQLKKNNVF